MITSFRCFFVQDLVPFLVDRECHGTCVLTATSSTEHFNETLAFIQWIDNLSHVMRLWYFSSSVNSFFKHACVAIQWARCLFYGRTLHLLTYFMCADSKGSGETARMRRLARAFTGRLCDKHHNLMSWLIANHYGNSITKTDSFAKYKQVNVHLQIFCLRILRLKYYMVFRYFSIFVAHAPN